MKNVLIVGSGGREHALGLALKRRASEVPSASRSDAVQLFFAPGHAGTAALGENVPIPMSDIEALAQFAEEKHIDLTIVGPEAPLALGVVDRFKRRGLAIVGPTRDAAALEWSKAYAKAAMRRYGVPTAEFAIVKDMEEARHRLRSFEQVVIKADGLAQGKGVIVADDEAEAIQALEMMLVEKRFGSSGETVVLEERLYGPEISVHALVAGGKYHILPPARDYKRAYDGDTGPNTGGMGAITPLPDVDHALLKQIEESIIAPMVGGMKEDGIDYCGILYAGLMITSDGPKVLEFNVRFGDPETQVLLPGYTGDWLEVFTGMAEGTLKPLKDWTTDAFLGVVIAQETYPERLLSEVALPWLEDEHLARIKDAHADLWQNITLHPAGVRREGEKLMAAGGRIATLVARGANLEEAHERAYLALALLVPDNAPVMYRQDIGR
ncbi:MAG: phosphoribosylamine--glycine ligase [Candidatus Carbobacillus altaicus]|nr:phosphoribosylamine--glycine ligase [Candidatus Carbobacillus altaicus]